MVGRFAALDLAVYVELGLARGFAALNHPLIPRRICLMRKAA